MDKRFKKKFFNDYHNAEFMSIPVSGKLFLALLAPIRNVKPVENEAKRICETRQQ